MNSSHVIHRIATDAAQSVGTNQVLDDLGSLAALCLWKEQMSDVIAYVDSGSHGNPGPSGIGVVIEGSGGEKVRIARWIGRQDNNVAEYVALLEALQQALSMGAKTLRVYSDSQVVVMQMTGEYVCQSRRLYLLNWTCRKVARSLDFSITHIRRDQNSEANELANHAARFGRNSIIQLDDHSVTATT